MRTEAQVTRADRVVHGVIILGNVSTTAVRQTPALKEWAVIVRALLAGEQILDVRKGGLRENDRHFSVESSRFWLYPSAEHQRPELIKPAYRRWVDDEIADAPADRAIRVSGWADVVASVSITDPDELAALDSRLIWTLDYADSRLKWKRRHPLWVLALRVHRLHDPIVVPFDDAYAGCTSWVDLQGLPAEPESLPSEPALTDTSFATRLEQVTKALPSLHPPNDSRM